MKDNRSLHILPVFCVLLGLLCACGNDRADTKPAEAELPVIQVTKEDAPEKKITETEEPEMTADSLETEETEMLSNPEDAFYITEITDEIFMRIKGKSFKDDCTLPREDLRYLHVLHKTKDGQTLEGELVVNVHIADTVFSTFTAPLRRSDR